MSQPQAALVIGASGGIGAAVVAALRTRGANVTTLSRRTDGIDVTDPQSVEAHLGALEGPFELIFLATGALEMERYQPERALRDITAEGLAAQFAVNAIGPALILQHVPRLVPRDRRAVFAALSGRVGSIEDNRLGGWYGYRASKAALNQILRSASIEIARTHRHAIVAALHPGTVATAFTRNYQVRHDTVSPDTAAQRLLAVIDSLTPADTGSFRDWAGKVIPW
jgi:NAD(P)-dependent dehydrogenase (short-subunit alcohol dehydrogenase family)